MSRPGEFVAGDVLAAAEVNTLPGGGYAYAAVTSGQSGIGTTEVDLTSLTVTVDLPAARRIKITGHGQFTQATAAGIPRLVVREGSTILGFAGRGPSHGTGSAGVVLLDGSIIIAPSSGSHTYKLSAATSTDTCQLSAAADNPAFILCEDIGPA